MIQSCFYGEANNSSDSLLVQYAAERLSLAEHRQHSVGHEKTTDHVDRRHSDRQHSQYGDDLVLRRSGCDQSADNRDTANRNLRPLSFRCRPQ